jgi:hypothetical protein
MAKKNFFGMLAVVLVFSMTVAGCVTSIPVSVTDPARLDMSGVKRIVILPFKTLDSSSLQKQTSMEIEGFLNQQLNTTGRFELVSSGGITQSNALSSIADAVIEGQIITLSVKDDTKTSTVRSKDADGNPVEKQVVTYVRALTLSFRYNITRTRDNSIIATENKSKTESASSSDSPGNLPEPLELARKVISATLGQVARDVAPSHRTVQRTLAALTTEESKNKDLKGQMNEALGLIKAKNYTGAAAVYGNIYASFGAFAAGYNQALATEAGDLDAAIALMADLVQKTNNPTAVGMLANMKGAQSGAQRSSQQLSEGRPLIDAAVEKVSKELLAKLPKGSRISLVGTSSGNTDLDYVIGAILNNLVSNGIIVVDRQNQSLIALEKKYQLSGDVSDETAVDIGRALGVSSSVFCSIDGSGRMRSLRVRAVDIETGKINYTVSINI